MTTSSALIELRSKLDNVKLDGFLGGEHRLRELGELAFKIARHESGARRVIAFIMYSVFDDHADNEADRNGSMSEAKARWDILERPIYDGMDILSNLSETINTDRIIESLLNAYFASF